MNLYYKNIDLKTFIVRRLRYFKLFNFLFPLGTGGSPEYSFRVWVRHLDKLFAAGCSQIPKIVAELGPGSTLGAGIAALLSGADQYYALDIQNYTNKDEILKDFDSLLSIFQNRHCEGIEFPHHILTEELLLKSLEEPRIKSLRNSILKNTLNSGAIKYYVPWTDEQLIVYESIDFIFSQCVLEHIDPLKDCYSSMYKWLKKDGYSSHLIDFQCHAFTKHWNGHWIFSTKKWNKLKGTRGWAINRYPASKHLEFATASGFFIINCNRIKTKKLGIQREEVNREFSYLTEEDFETTHIDVLLKK